MGNDAPHGLRHRDVSGLPASPSRVSREGPSDPFASVKLQVCHSGRGPAKPLSWLESSPGHCSWECPGSPGGVGWLPLPPPAHPERLHHGNCLQKLSPELPGSQRGRDWLGGAASLSPGSPLGWEASAQEL